MKRIIAIALLVSVCLFLVGCAQSLKDKLVGPWWELQAEEGLFYSETYKDGEGKLITFRTDGVVLDYDNFFGYDFDDITWKLSDETLSVYLNGDLYGDFNCEINDDELTLKNFLYGKFVFHKTRPTLHTGG